MMAWSGVLLIVGSILCGGFCYASAIKQEVRRMEGLLHLARQIRTRIAYFRQPLSAIYADFSDEALDRCGFTEALRKGDFMLALLEKKDALGLRPALIDLAIEFAGELGKSGTEDQTRHCDRCIAEMEKALSALKAEGPDRIRLIRALSLCFAAMAALLLI